jgi:hypothetical protein
MVVKEDGGVWVVRPNTIEKKDGGVSVEMRVSPEGHRYRLRVLLCYLGNGTLSPPELTILLHKKRSRNNSIFATYVGFYFTHYLVLF